ncbi:MAG: NnrS family protein [Gammaproteobacteria bacterium]|nr:NnrS family protein [Gammaproteobacteria bacterium]
MSKTPWTLLNYAFRPFFLFGGIFAIVAIAVWALALRGIPILSLTYDRNLWHAHEMLLGFATGGVAAFILTAVATWTGRTPVQGPWLGILVLGWLVGRLAMCFVGRIPDFVVTAADMLFPLLLAGLAAREIIGGRSHHNYHLVAILGLIATANLGFHLAGDGASARIWLGLLLHLLLLVVTIIGGRIIPSFTANWLRAHGSRNVPVIHDWLDNLVLAATVVAGLADGIWPGTPAAGIAALAAGSAHIVRFSRWRTTAIFSEPLLVILHLAYCWILLGYLLLSLASFGLFVPRVVALHALGMGGLGGMILAVATRVGLAHTGRPLQVSRVTIAAYWLLGLAVTTRLVSPLFAQWYVAMLDLSAALWMLTFGLFVWVYGPMVLRPRADGRPERPTIAIKTTIVKS